MKLNRLIAELVTLKVQQALHAHTDRYHGGNAGEPIIDLNAKRIEEIEGEMDTVEYRLDMIEGRLPEVQ